MQKIVFNQVAIEITRRCNMTCAHCLRGRAQPINIPLRRIDELLDQTEAIGRLIITGGEPTLNLPALQYIANSITRHGTPVMRVQIVTNGLQYDDSFLAIVKRYAEIVNITQQAGYGRDEREPWRVQIGVSLDAYHAQQKACKKNYIKMRQDLRGIAEVLKVCHGNAPRNEGRAATLPDTIDFSKTVSTYVLQKIEVLSADHKPSCKFFESYYLTRPDQKVVCCGIYLNALGQILPGCACDTDFDCRGAIVCNSSDPIWENILRYNLQHERMSCAEADDYRTKILLIRSRTQANRENALSSAPAAQDEPSAEPMYTGTMRRYQSNLKKWLTPDNYGELEKAASAKNYFYLNKDKIA